MPSTRLPDPRTLPQWGDGKFLYALKTSDGSVKIGCTGTARCRFALLRSELRRRGLAMTHFLLAPPISELYCSESELRKRMERIGVLRPRTREWFYGVSWGAACTLLRQVCAREIVRLPY